MAYQKELLAAFSEPTRQVILERLGRKSRTVGDLARELPISRPAVSQHLKVLKSVGLVEERRRGSRHYFHLNPTTLGELRAHVDGMWQDALAAFSEYSKENSSQERKARTPRR